MAPEYYIFTGQRVPDHVTHVLIDKALKFVAARAFYEHSNIEEVICHAGVEKIEREAFYNCPRLRRVIMSGVKEVEKDAFTWSKALTYLECGKLEIIGQNAFLRCTSLSSVDLLSIKVVESGAFCDCESLTNVKFGIELVSIREAFYRCTSLERITLPLKDDLITDDSIFLMCEKLNRVDLVGGVHETIAAFLMEEWKDDMNGEIDTISQILPNTYSGGGVGMSRGKAREIRTWISAVLRKYNNYKAEHRRYVNEAAATLQLALPNDIVHKNILPFVELPPHTFDGED